MSSESSDQDPYRIPTSESFLRELPEKPPTDAVISETPPAPPVSEPRLQSLCWQLFALAERLADEGAPDRATLKEQLFLVGQNLRKNFRTSQYARATPLTARLARESELPSASSLWKIPITKFPEFDFPRIREFLAQHTSSRYTVPLIRALVHHCTWNLLDISDRRAFLLSLVAFDVLGGAPAVFARLAENSGTSEIFGALISVIACEWTGRNYIAKFPLLPLVQNLMRAPVDSPVFIQMLGAFQRLSFNGEIGNFLIECRMHEFLLSNVASSTHSEFALEFSLALISNLADCAGFYLTEGGMTTLKHWLRHPEISSVKVLCKIATLPGMRDLAFSVGVDEETSRLAGESENAEDFRSLLVCLHEESRTGTANVISDSPGLCFLEDEELAQLVIGRNLAKDTFVTRRFVGGKEDDRKYFEEFLLHASQGKLPTSLDPQPPPASARAKHKIWR